MNSEFKMNKCTRKNIHFQKKNQGEQSELGVDPVRRINYRTAFVRFCQSTLAKITNIHCTMYNVHFLECMYVNSLEFINHLMIIGWTTVTIYTNHCINISYEYEYLKQPLQRIHICTCWNVDQILQQSTYKQMEQANSETLNTKSGKQHKYRIW